MRITVEQPGKTEIVMVADDTRVRGVVQLATGYDDASRYAVRVNDDKAGYDDSLLDGDIISLIPRKVDGAC